MDLRYIISFRRNLIVDNSRIYISFASLSWQPSGIFFARHYEMERELEHKRFEAFQEQLQMAIGLHSSGIEQIKRKGVKNVYEGKDTKPEASEIMKIHHLINTKLRKTVRDVPQGEKEVQDR